MSEELVKQIINEPKQVRFSDEQLRHFNFNQLPQQQFQMLDKLSFFNSYSKMYRVLTKQYGEAKNKQRFIKENANYLTANETVLLNKNIEFLKFRTFTFPAYAVSICTLGAFFLALWRLPSRMSTVKYTVTGFAGGVLLSYGYWKYSMFQYYQTLNKLFRTVTVTRYSLQKK